MKVKTNVPFSVPIGNFGISAPTADYNIQYSIDGVHFTAKAVVPAGETLLWIGGVNGCIFNLDSAVDEELFVQW